MRSKLVFILAAVLIGLATGCPSSPGKEPVVIVGSQWYAHIPAMVGIEAGIFDRHGFAPEFKVTTQSAERISAMASGRIHFASLGQISMLTALAHGNDTFYWVGHQDVAPGFEGLVGGKNVSSFDDLKGKSIGFPFYSSVDITVRQLLKRNGLSPEDVRFVKLDTGSVPSAVETGPWMPVPSGNLTSRGSRRSKGRPCSAWIRTRRSTRSSAP